MPVPHRPAVRPVLALLALATALTALTALTACSAGTDPDAAAPPAPPPATEPTTEPTAEPSATTPAAPDPAPAATVIEVTYADGQLTGVDPRVEVARGEQVVLRVTSDVAEEVHVHGYDLYIDIPAGGTGEAAFTADIPGAYEVELHEVGRPIFQLRVT